MDVVENAYQAAKTARERAYAPYSGFRVGAAVKAVGYDRIFCGCNVENASYGATICAERAAVAAMIAELGQAKIEFVVVVSDESPPCSPCGVCRQVIAEFADGLTPVYLADTTRVVERLTLDALLPRRFVLER